MAIVFKRIKNYFFIPLFFVVLAPAFALNCKTAYTTFDLNICTKRDLDIAQKKLNQVYAQSLKKAQQMDEAGSPTMPQKVKPSLEKAQELWLQYQKAACDNLLTVFNGGQEATMRYLACKTNMITNRINELTALYFN